MSQRDGHGSGRVVAPPIPSDGPKAVPGGPPSAILPIEEANRSLSISHQQKDIEFDGRPAKSSPAAAQSDPTREFLHAVLANELLPVELAEPVSIFDTALDDYQRDAVARAIQVNELFVIEGPSGTGKTRVGVEIANQVVSRGSRVLFLSPTPGAIEVLLPRLATEKAVVRRLAPTESVNQLPLEIAAFTMTGRRAALRLRLQQSAELNLAAAADKLATLERLLPIWEKLVDLRNKQSHRRAAQETRRSQLHSLADDVRREAESNTDSAPYNVQRLRQSDAAHARRMAALEASAEDLQARRQTAEAELRTAESDCQSLKPKAAAIEHGRWYTLTFWKARSEGTVLDRLTQAEARLTQAKEKLDELAKSERKLADDLRIADQEHAAERSRFLEAETHRRKSELIEAIEQTDREIESDGQIELALRADLLKVGTDDSQGLAFEAVINRAVREHAQAQEAARDTLTRLDELVSESVRHVDIVAGPIAGIASDPDVAAVGSFDTLIVDDAHRLAEAEFLAAARLARRWILLGEPIEAVSTRGRATQASLFARLATALRHDVWVQDSAKLTCRLYPVRGTVRRRLECEPVADAPEIELRVFNPPDGEPTLAEVAFPSDTSPAIAREYLHRELGEMTCQPRCRTVRWEEVPDGIIARFGPADPAASIAEIGSGIREELVGLETRAVRFDSDWTFDRAKTWVAENIGRRESGRIAFLSRPQRACPGLAQWLNSAFDVGFQLPAAVDDAAHVEFLAVPDTDSRRRHEPRRPSNGRVGGAGYEIDLADPRRRAAIPVDFADLPSNGFVNVPEAQALIRYLESLNHVSNIAVTAPYPSQVTVLRRLIARSPRLADVTVLDVDEAPRHECDLLAVSLTRSHVNRAVTFGERPGILAGLLARARKKLLFAGDPGTLARRLQWEGPVDHLDAAESFRERGWIAALADCPRVTPPRHRSLAEAAR